MKTKETLYTLFFSPTHTSQTIAQAVADGLGIKYKVSINLTYDTPKEDINIDGGWAVIAVPVYGGRISETAAERLSFIHAKNTRAILCVLYGNRDYEDALIELSDLTQKQGFIPISGGAFIGEHSYSRKNKEIASGRPDAQDINRAYRFGKISGEYIKNWGNKIPKLIVKGNVPYKVKGTQIPQAPITLYDICSQCGHCINICPTHAINNKIESSPEFCIKCCACVKECPNEARIFETPFTDWLYQNCSVPKKIEMFFCGKYNADNQPLPFYHPEDVL